MIDSICTSMNNLLGYNIEKWYLPCSASTTQPLALYIYAWMSDNGHLSVLGIVCWISQQRAPSNDPCGSGKF